MLAGAMCALPGRVSRSLDALAAASASSGATTGAPDDAPQAHGPMRHREADEPGCDVIDSPDTLAKGPAARPYMAASGPAAGGASRGAITAPADPAPADPAPAPFPSNTMGVSRPGDPLAGGREPPATGTEPAASCVTDEMPSVTPPSGPGGPPPACVITAVPAPTASAVTLPTAPVVDESVRAAALPTGAT